MRVSNGGVLKRSGLLLAVVLRAFVVSCAAAAAANGEMLERLDASTRGGRRFAGAETQRSTSSFGVRVLQATTACNKYGCEAVLPCGIGCQSAFALCNYDAPLCFTNSTAQILPSATVQWGWTNPVKCRGGSIACNLWIGAEGCNISASTSQVVGTVTIDTASNQILYEITDDVFRMSSVQVYVGPTEVPVVDGSLYSISPEDYTFQSWLDPKAKHVTIGPVEKLVPGVFVIAHANVCLVDSTNEVPEVWVPPANATDPLCPIRAPDLCSSTTTLLTPTPAPILLASSKLFEPTFSDSPSSTPSYGAVGLPSQPVNSTCPFHCGNLSCVDGCLDAFAYCPGALCLGPDSGGLVTWGHSNPVNCTGGLVQCELWTGDDCNHTNGELIGLLYIDTDRNVVRYDMSNDGAWEVSSTRVYVGSSSLFEPFEQKVWYDPNQKSAVFEMYSDIHAGAFVIAQALVCPVVSVPPSPANVPLNATVESCPVPAKVHCPSNLPTSGLATNSQSPAISPEGAATAAATTTTTTTATATTTTTTESPAIVPVIAPLVLSPLASPVAAPQAQPSPTPAPFKPPASPPRRTPVPTADATPEATVLPTPRNRPTPAPIQPRATPTFKPTRRPTDGTEEPSYEGTFVLTFPPSRLFHPSGGPTLQPSPSSTTTPPTPSPTPAPQESFPPTPTPTS